MTLSPLVLAGDALDVLPTIADASIDAVVCDPPYALGFMGHAWDTHTPQGFQAWCEAWARECLRVLKPGGHLLAFGGTRTVHRLTSGIEDAGFEIRDSLMWIYGSGFPKSLDVSKAIDRTRNDRGDWLKVTSWLADRADQALITRADVDAHMGTSDMGNWWLSRLEHRCALPTLTQWDRLRDLIGFGSDMDAEVLRLNLRKGEPGEAWADRPVIATRERKATGRMAQGEGGYAFGERFTDTDAATDAARQWTGWGTALKPAHEPVVVARKPLAAGTVAANVQTHGTGAININACRTSGVDAPEGRLRHGGGSAVSGSMSGPLNPHVRPPSPAGRWPTNVVMSHAGDDDTGDACANRCVPECPVAALDEQTGTLKSGGGDRGKTGRSGGLMGADSARTTAYSRDADKGGASRFYPMFRYQAKAPARERPKVDGVSHSTVKPLDLMRWLVRLVTPPGGRVLDPFAGSGTTVEACILEGFDVTAVERPPPYLPLIAARIARVTADITGIELTTQ